MSYTTEEDTPSEAGGWNGDEDAVVRGRVKVCFVALGESLFGGDYNPDDPQDVEVLRFDFYGLLDGEWLPCLGASYCTRVPVSTPQAERRALLEQLCRDGASGVEEGLNELIAEHRGERAAAGAACEFRPKSARSFEELSWISAPPRR